MGNIIEINIKPNIRFCVRAATIELYKDKFKKPSLKKHSIIVLRNNDNEKEVAHPISDFIYKYWKSNEYNTMAIHSFETCRFLNWIYFDSEEKVDDLSKITIPMCSRFLLFLTEEGHQRDTVKKYEKVLVKLLRYLFEKNLLDKITLKSIIYLEENSFPGIIYNKKEISKRIHDFKPELIIPFIETAFHETPRIALGVYYQIFGGLRVGEVVNVSQEGIYNVGAYGEFGQIIKIEDKSFRPDLNTISGKGEVKVNRGQVIFSYRSLLKKLYSNHIGQFKAKNGSNALFVNSDGNAMTGGSYEYYFKKLKRIFIERLEESEEILLKTYANYLKTCEWSTHIGRGIFTNLMAEYTDNILEVAIARGDKNLNSSLTYMADTKRILTKIQNELDILYTGDFLD